MSIRTVQKIEYGIFVRDLIRKEVERRNICLITEGSLLDLNHKENKTYSNVNINYVADNFGYELIKPYNNAWLLRKSYKDKDIVFPCVSPEGIMQTGQNWFDILINLFPEIRIAKQTYQIIIEKKLQEMFFSEKNRLIKYNSPIRITLLEKSNIDTLYNLFLYSTVGDALMYLKRVFPDFLNINKCKVVIDNKLSQGSSLLLLINENGKRLLLGREVNIDKKFGESKLVPSKGIFLRDALDLQFSEKNRLVLSDPIKRLPIEIINKAATSDDRIIRSVQKLFELELINQPQQKKLVQKLVHHPKSASQLQIALRDATILPFLNYIENNNTNKTDRLGTLVLSVKNILDDFKEKMIKEKKAEIPFSDTPYEIQLASSIQIVCENLSLKYFYNRPDLMNYPEDQIWANFSVTEQRNKKYASIGLLRPNAIGELEGSFSIKFEITNR
ncbi:hypothetical protein [Armatimonas sp.]|uniref:hypothetical protein n=1 Tax=Armatimonas sp. TaxID=1872638 RepID=UPI003752D646